MRLTALWLCLLTVGCANCAVPVPAQEPAAPPAPPPPKSVTVIETPAVVAVVKSFDAAKSREMGAVVRSGVTVDSVERIYRADLRARIALRALGLNRLRMSEPLLREARASVRALQEALDGEKDVTDDRPPDARKPPL